VSGKELPYAYEFLMASVEVSAVHAFRGCRPEPPGLPDRGTLRAPGARTGGGHGRLVGKDGANTRAGDRGWRAARRRRRDVAWARRREEDPGGQVPRCEDHLWS